jgi:Ca2+-binding RTX toxin-like protein
MATFTGTLGNDILNGTSAADTINGLGGNDTIDGGAGNDNIDAGGGDDKVMGGAGDDNINGGAGNDIIDGGTGNDIIAGGSSDDTMFGADGDDTMDGGSGDDLMYGGIGVDIMVGGSGADLLDGGDGNDNLSGDGNDDTLIGGLGDDRLDGGGGTNTASYAGSLGAVTVNLTTGKASGAAGNDTLLGISNLIGGDAGDTLTGNSLANRIDGGAGDDTITGASGDDILLGSAGNDLFLHDAGNDSIDGGADTDTVSYADLTTQSVNINLNTGRAVSGSETDTLANIENAVGGGAADTLIGNAGANRLEGGAGNDALSAGDGNDILDGGVGNDTLAGGAGDDTYLINDAGVSLLGDAITEAANAGTDLVLTSLSSYTLGANLENLRYVGDYAATGTFIGSGNDLNNKIEGGAGVDALAGGAGDDIVWGNNGDDFIVGGAGADNLDGGVGTDLVSYNNATVAVTLDLANGYALSADGNDVVAGFENVLGSQFADDLSGNLFANIIDGSAGDDRISGRDGADTLFGGTGNDILSGGGDRDAIDGGAGNDTVDYDYPESIQGVTVNLQSGTAAVNVSDTDTLTGIENVLGGAGDDNITGDGGVNRLSGGAGADTIDGGSGADILDGGAGSDWVSYASASLGVSVNLVAGTGIAGSDTDSLSNFENVTGSAFADTLTGNAASNALNGGGGNDILDGGAGDDLLAGGNGDDLYYVDSTLDQTAESGNQGHDTVRASGSANLSYTLGANVEDLIYSGTGQFGGTGNALDNLIVGGDGINVLNGGAGNDTLDGGNTLSGRFDVLAGGAGDDLYILDNPNFVNGVSSFLTLTESAGEGTDTVQTISAFYALKTNFENLTFTTPTAHTGLGNFGDNRITGNIGDDTLAGGAGNDTLLGGDGNDLLNGGAGSNVIHGGAGVDTISYADFGRAVSVSLFSGVANLRFADPDPAVALHDVITNVESVMGSAFGDQIVGSGGSDTLSGGDGDDSIFGGSGNDTLTGGAGADRLEGGFGDDTYLLTDGDLADVVVEPGAGVDSDNGVDTVHIESLGDRSGTSIAYTLPFKVEILVYTGNANFTGNGFAIYTGDGNDTLIGQADGGIYDGGAGFDYLDFSANPPELPGRVVNLTDGTTTSGSASLTGYLGNIEGVRGTSAGDVILGDGNVNALFGMGGNDFISGGAGSDTLAGGAGNDIFYFAPGAGSGDVIQDFLTIHRGLAEFDKVDLTAYGPGATLSTTLDAAGTGTVVTVSGAGAVDTFTVLGVPPAVFDQSDCIFA